MHLRSRPHLSDVGQQVHPNHHPIPGFFTCHTPVQRNRGGCRDSPHSIGTIERWCLIIGAQHYWESPPWGVLTPTLHFRNVMSDSLDAAAWEWTRGISHLGAWISVGSSWDVSWDISWDSIGFRGLS